MMVTFGWVGFIKKLISDRKIRSIPVNDGILHHRVKAENKGNLAITPREGAYTLYDLVKSSFETYAEKKCMGTREYLGQHTPKVKKFGGVSWKTYGEVGFEAHKFGAALRATGVVPAPDTTTLKQISTPCSLAIFENTWYVLICIMYIIIIMIIIIILSWFSI